MLTSKKSVNWFEKRSMPPTVGEIRNADPFTGEKKNCPVITFHITRDITQKLLHNLH
jgi:hypothetical protein